MERRLNEVNAKAIIHYGITTQSVVCMEELAELIKEISKQLRGIGDKERLTEEVADVYICLDMLAKMYNIDAEQLKSVIYKKLDRTEKRVEAGKTKVGFLQEPPQIKEDK